MAIICKKGNCRDCEHCRKDFEEDRMSCFLMYDTIEKITKALKLNKESASKLSSDLKTKRNSITWLKEIEDLKDPELLNDFNTVADLPPSVVCEQCGKRVWLLNSLTNPCECGALYNLFGQRLEDTVEDPSSPYHDGKIF